jgi:maltooligosyltrehalose trehalohydrolase
MLFMGEEWGAESPFQFFISHTDATLVERVRDGRRQEFAAFAWKGSVPDPQSEATFAQSVLGVPNPRPHQEALRQWYQTLIALRKSLRCWLDQESRAFKVFVLEPEECVLLQYTDLEPVLLVAFCFSKQPETIRLPKSGPDWSKLLDSADSQWSGTSRAGSVTVEGGCQNEFIVQAQSAVVLAEAGFAARCRGDGIIERRRQ